MTNLIQRSPQNARLGFIPGVVLFCIAAMVGLPPLQAAAPPNIVLIISDDQAWNDYGFMGHPEIKTPRLDQLKEQSLFFPRGYVPTSLCCPSLATIVTGLYPHQHKVVCNDPPNPQGLPRGEFYQTQIYRDGRHQMSRFLEEVDTLPRLLQQRGYVSLQTGKWWQNHYSRGGFTHGMTQGDEDEGGRHGDVGLKIGRDTMEPIYEFVKTAVQDNKPFLVWYAPFLPHEPHTPPERLIEKYRAAAPSEKIARYWAMVEWFDETCGQLLDFLDDQKLSDNTIIAYVADNGWITDPITGHYAPRSKQSPYEGGLRTPILLRWPGHITPGEVEAPVSSVDLMPTLLHAVGMPVPKSLPGKDLLNVEALQQRDTVFGACFTHDGVDLSNPATGLRWRWVIQGDWKLILPAPQNEPDGQLELYQITSDPFEQQDLAESESRRVIQLQQLADQWWDGKL